MNITKTELETMYKTMENKDICNRLGITNPTLVNYLKKNNIALKGKGNRNPKTKIKITE